MKRLQTFFQDFCRELEGVLAVGVVDISSGSLLSLHLPDNQSAGEDMELSGGPVAELFRENSSAGPEKEEGKANAPVSEIFIDAANAFNFMKLVDGKKAVIFMLTKKSVNQGMGWSSLKTAVNEVSNLL